jgi:DNA-binding response OmpR family regulator
VERTVVVVEDDPAIADLVDLYLRDAGFRVLLAPTGERGLELVHQHRPVLAVLDIGLPGIDGFEVCRRIRATSTLPILFLSARDGEIDRVLGLELGADDYLVKPFSPRELVARVKAILRRGEAREAGAGPVLEVGEGIEVDLARREARVAGRPVGLATREFDLLAFLARNLGIALSRQQLLDGVWGPGWVGDERTVDVHVRQLRRKLGDGLPLATVWGIGYRLG